MSTTATPRFVLDGSLTLAWHFADEASPYADAVALELAARAAVVPSLWRLEVASALIVGERRKRGDEAQTTRFLARLEQLPIVIDDQTDAQAWSQTIRLARSHKLSVYDAAYLEIALRQGLPLASLDVQLNAAAAAAAVGVPRFAVTQSS